MKKITTRQIQKTIIAIVTVTFFLGLTSFTAKCNDIENNVLRLHILANSDLTADQELKLKVRDAVLERGRDIFADATNAVQAEENVLASSDLILETAREVIRAEGYDYDVTLEVTDDAFPTRTYGDITLPAGTYRAVRLVIGEGEGHNWWCVMFPAICLPGASKDTSIDAVLTEGESKLVKADPKVDVRFKIAEVVQFIGQEVSEKITF